MWILVAAITAALALIGVKLFWDQGLRGPPNTVPAQEPIQLPTQGQLPNYKSDESVLKIDPIKPGKPVGTWPRKKSGSEQNADSGGKVRLCPGISDETVTVASDGSILGHLPYADASAGSLTSPPPGFGGSRCAQIHSAAKSALAQMIAAARAHDPALGDAMIGLSCFRSSQYQREVFCRKVSDGFAVRARSSAPPGYSEHATGYVMDFGDKNHPECDLSACFATTPVGQWLTANAGKFGFVLSFPKGNGQGKMYEPWHWRYEGSSGAKATFARAR